MSVSVTAHSMYGVVCPSFNNAIGKLLYAGIISQQEYEEYGQEGEIDHKEYSYEPYSAYSEQGGVLGIYVTARDYNFAPIKSKSRVGAVKSHFYDAKFHVFCQTY